MQSHNRVHIFDERIKHLMFVSLMMQLCDYFHVSIKQQFFRNISMLAFFAYGYNSQEIYKNKRQQRQIWLKPFEGFIEPSIA